MWGSVLLHLQPLCAWGLISTSVTVASVGIFYYVKVYFKDLFPMQSVWFHFLTFGLKDSFPWKRRSLDRNSVSRLAKN